jgi:hypothetical protein
MTAPQPPRNVAALLNRLSGEEFSGAVSVRGIPGGVVHVSRGLVVSVRTPAAPPVETLLVKSRRISQEDWSAAHEHSVLSGAGTGSLAAALVDRGVIGRAELDVTCTAALFDAAFAMSLRPAAGWDVDPQAPPPDPAVLTGIAPRRLTEETTRRAAALRRTWNSLSEFAAAPIRPSSRIESTALNPRYRDILLHANGRRTPRDLAFVLGRGVFAVMSDLERMHNRELIRWEAPRAAPAPSVAPRRATAAEIEAGRVESGAPLPRRTTRGRNAEGLAPEPRQPSETGGPRRRGALGFGALARPDHGVDPGVDHSADHTADDAPGPDPGPAAEPDPGDR